jgi:hypothetical protein
MSVTISIRVDDEVKENIEELGYKPGDYLKKILIQELKKEQSRKALLWLKKHKIKSKGKTAEELIRKDRDSK